MRCDNNRNIVSPIQRIAYKPYLVAKEGCSLLYDVAAAYSKHFDPVRLA